MNNHVTSSCIFCKIINRIVPSTVIMENESLLVIKDIAPKAPVHYLIIPKQHAQDIRSLSQDQLVIAVDIVSVAQALALQHDPVQDFKLIINNGARAGQQVFHLHAHYLSGDELSGLV